MIKIAITGGIGSGKSTAVAALKQLGYKCESADEVYRELLRNENFVENLSEYMGVKPLCVDGKKTLDKKALSEKVFSDVNELKKLNEYTHPAIMDVLLRKMKWYPDEVVFAEVPVLFERGYENLFDYVIIITKELQSRVEKTMLRDGKTEDDVKKVIEMQFDYGKIEPRDNFFVVKNDGSVEDLKNKMVEVIEEIIKKREKKVSND